MEDGQREQAPADAVENAAQVKRVKVGDIEIGVVPIPNDLYLGIRVQLSVANRANDEIASLNALEKVLTSLLERVVPDPGDRTAAVDQVCDGKVECQELLEILVSGGELNREQRRAADRAPSARRTGGHGGGSRKRRR